MIPATDNISNAGWVRVFKYSSSTNSWDQMGQSIVGSREDIFGAGLSILQTVQFWLPQHIRVWNS